jgi:hypothetical protein
VRVSMVRWGAPGVAVGVNLQGWQGGCFFFFVSFDVESGGGERPGRSFFRLPFAAPIM